VRRRRADAAAIALVNAVTSDSMIDLLEAAELLDVDLDQLARRRRS
jgi:hypothetical protein